MHIHTPLMLLETLYAWFARHEAVLVLDDHYGDLHSSGLSDSDSPDHGEFYLAAAPADPPAHAAVHGASPGPSDER